MCNYTVCFLCFTIISVTTLYIVYHRAVDYFLNNRSMESLSNHNDCMKLLSYHGDLNSSLRTKNLLEYRNKVTTDGFLQQNNNNNNVVLIATDIAARGLDIPETNHIIMFDFPLNSIDYLHRAGRTGRAGKSGTVTAIIQKRDIVLSKGILAAMKFQYPIDDLTSNKDDYYNIDGKFHFLIKDDLKLGLPGYLTANNNHKFHPKIRNVERKSNPRVKSNSNSKNNSNQNQKSFKVKVTSRMNLNKKVDIPTIFY